MFFGKQIIDMKQLKLNKFILDFKQLKTNRFIKSISDLVSSTSNATLEVPSLRPRLKHLKEFEALAAVEEFSKYM